MIIGHSVFTSIRILLTCSIALFYFHFEKMEDHKGAMPES